MPFQILTYFTESGAKKTEAISYRSGLKFSANSMK